MINERGLSEGSSNFFVEVDIQRMDWESPAQVDLIVNPLAFAPLPRAVLQIDIPEEIGRFEN